MSILLWKKFMLLSTLEGNCAIFRGPFYLFIASLKWPSRCRPKILLLLRYYDAGQYCTRTMCWHSESGLIKNITMQFSWHLWKLGFTYGIAFVSQFVFVYECGIWCLCFVQGTVFVFVCDIWVSVFYTGHCVCACVCVWHMGVTGDTDPSRSDKAS